MNTIKLNVIGELASSAEGGSGGGGGNTPSGGEGVVTIDFSSIGYDNDDAKFVQDKAKADIAYSKTLYDAWDASRTNTYNLYNNNKKIVYAPNIDTSNVTTMGSMFNNCSALTTIPQLDTSSVTDMSNMFSGCKALTFIPQLDTSSVTDMSSMFYYCSELTTIPQLNTSNVTDMGGMFDNCSALENLGGFVNCKVSLNLSNSSKLTHQSLINVINNLYDLTANGLSGQTLTLGSTNMAKLTADEIAIATNKGWTIK